MGDNLPDQHLRGGVLHLTAVAIVHLRITERQNLLNVAALEVIQLQLPIGRPAGFLGGVRGVILSAQRRSVGFHTICIHSINCVIGDFAGVEIVTVAVRPVHLVPMALPATGLIGSEGHAGGLAHGAAATQQRDTAVVHTGQSFAVHGGGFFVGWFRFGIFRFFRSLVRL